MSSTLHLTAHPSFLRPQRRVHLARIKKPSKIKSSQRKLEPLYDDGYMTPKGIKDYHDAVSDLLRFNEGTPRWFCPVECGPPVEGSPVLLFLPGIDGIGMGLFMHHKALGRIFEVRCLHIPFSDRTTLEGLLKFVGDAIRLEHSVCQKRPIYLLGHSFGGCLALSVAARNPDIDLIVILTNPATSFERSKLQPLFSVLRSSFGQLNLPVSLFFSLNVGNLLKKAIGTTSELNPLQTFDKLSRNLINPLQQLSHLLDHMPNKTFSWKLKLLKLAAEHANSCLHAVKAEVLVLASCADSMLPSRDEGEKLAKFLLKCKVYYFENLDHNILLETDVHLCSIIKSADLYRHSRQHDYIRDFHPTTMTELQVVDKMAQNFYLATSPVMLSTMDNGKIVRGLHGVPTDGPVLLVGNHMLMAFDILPLVAEFLREKRVVLRGMAHPMLFPNRRECSAEGHHLYDLIRTFGAVPATNGNLYKLLSGNSSVLLYPGGPLEVFHRKGEDYKLHWPSQPEFVRMAARFGARIVPFGVVGEDDICEMLLDYEDLLRIPFTRDIIKGTEFGKRLRGRGYCIPFIQPRLPGRFYYLFGKPIRMSGKIEVLEEREAAKAMYLHVKSEVESLVSYLLKKREEDVYRSIFKRALYRTISGSSHQIPTFEP